MANSPLLPIFQKAYHNTDLTPLVQPEHLKTLWVEYGREALEALVQLVEDHAARMPRLFFRGIGVAASLRSWHSLAGNWAIAISSRFSQSQT
jgi:hypothetical protein